jgi:Kef-type K+ transport system membrane component KefB
MEVFSDLLILLVLARSFGVVVERIGLPASVGEILAGVLISVLALVYGDTFTFATGLIHSDFLFYSSQIAIFFLALFAGIEMQPQEIARGSRYSIIVALGGIVLPLLGGFLLTWYFIPGSDNRLVLSLLTGVVLSTTAVPATTRVLQELGLMQTRLAKTVIGAALFDDVAGLFLLSILLTIIKTGSVPDIAVLAILTFKVAVFIGITIALGVHVYPRVSKGLNTLQATSLEFSALSLVGLAYGLFAEALGIHWILGAFMAGLFFEKARVGIRSYTEIKLLFTAITSGLLGPLFFSYIGMKFDPSALFNIPVFLVLLLVVAIIGKVAGCGIPARLAGFRGREALSVGIGMSSRGAINFVVLSIAFGAGAFEITSASTSVERNLFSALVFMGIVTTMIVPPLLKWANKK